MKSIIEKSGMTLKEFSIRFEIPYNTVSQWYRGERNAPRWVKNLIEDKLFGESILEQLDRAYNPDIYIHEYYENENLKYRTILHYNEEDQEKIEWFNKCKKKFEKNEEGINKTIMYKGYKEIEKWVQ